MQEIQELKFKFQFNMFFIKRKDGQVVSFSEERPETISNAHEIEEIEIDEQKLKEIKQAKQVKIKDGKIEIIQFEPDYNIEIKLLVDKFTNNTISKEEKDRALFLLLQKSQI